MLLRRRAYCCSLVLLWVLSPHCFGQGTGSTRTSGTTSGGTTSTAAAGGAVGANATFGGSSTGIGTGAAGAGASSGGLTQPTFTQFGQAGANIGTGFVGRGNNAQTFVGQQAAGQQTVDAGGTARFSGLGGSGGGTGGTINLNQARAGQMRIPRVVRFETPVIPAQTTELSLRTHFETHQTQMPGVNVRAISPGHVVLEGAVASEHHQRLAEALARLEPGVRHVTNSLQVTEHNRIDELPLLGR